MIIGTPGAARLAKLPEPIRSEVLTALVEAKGTQGICRRMTNKEIDQALKAAGGLGRHARERLITALSAHSIIAVFPRPDERGLRPNPCEGNTPMAAREMRAATPPPACDARSATAQETALSGATAVGSHK